jgi:hypothetical protein
MAQHDLVIDNASGATVRADINGALAALGSTMKGSGAPPAPLAGKQWIEDDFPSTSIWTWRVYDGTDWIEVGRIDTASNTFVPRGLSLPGTAAAPGFAIAGDTDTGIFSPAANTLAFSAGGTERLRLQAGGALFDSVINARGLVNRAGFSGGTGSDNIINIFWTGSGAALWVDDTNTGVIQVSSDRRIKHTINDAPSALALVQQLRPVTYRFRNEGIYRDDGVTRWGFIADEVQAVIPSAVVGAPDAETGGQVQPQNIIDRPIIAALTKALQEAAAQISALEARIAALEASA